MGHPWRIGDDGLGRAALMVIMLGLGVGGPLLRLLWHVVRRVWLLVVLLLVLAVLVYLVAFGLQHHLIYPAPVHR